jgi:hypothetical protein
MCRLCHSCITKAGVCIMPETLPSPGELKTIANGTLVSIGGQEYTVVHGSLHFNGFSLKPNGSRFTDGNETYCHGDTLQIGDNTFVISVIDNCIGLMPIHFDQTYQRFHTMGDFLANLGYPRDALIEITTPNTHTRPTHLFTIVSPTVAAKGEGFNCTECVSDSSTLCL